jgi:copper homeostasis protein
MYQKMDPVKEVCVESFHEAVAAVTSGAGRIELCDHLACGGTTPSSGTIRQVIGKLHIPVMVMIRPRGGDFCYTRDEYEIMCHDIEVCRKLNSTGVVFGLLNQDKTIDIERTAQLVSLARPMEVTFHKAIDESKDILLSVRQLINIGIDRILTSGGQSTAIDGGDMLRKMIEMANDQLKIIVSGKVTWENFDEVRRLIPSTDYHGRKLVKF